MGFNDPTHLPQPLRFPEPEDEDDVYSRHAQREIDAEAEAERMVKDSDWWKDKLGGLSLGNEAATCLARCLTNLDAACSGDPISRQAILTALSNLQRQARADAKDEAM